jgi:hypothetical protein
MKSFDIKQKDINFTIYVTQQNMDILIQCKVSNGNYYSSVFDLEKMKTIDKLFCGIPPLPLIDINDILCKYFKDNIVTIKEITNARVIIEIDKDFKPNMKFELERDQINNNNIQKNEKVNNDMNNQIMDINNNDKVNDIENVMNNNNSNNISNYTDKIINNGINNINNSMNNINMDNNNYENYNQNNDNSNHNNNNFNDNYNSNNNYKNNNCSNNYNNINHNNNKNNNNGNNKILNNNNIININNKNDFKNNIFVNLNSKEKNLGGLINNKIDNDNPINDNIFYNNNNSHLDNFFNNYKNKNNHENEKQNQISSSLNVRIGQPKNNQEGNKKNLSCFLKFLLITRITNKVKNISKYDENFKNVEEVIKLIKNNQDFNGNKNWKNKNNILDYLKYLDNKNLDRNSLLENIFSEDKKVKNEIFDYWKYLSIYEEYNNNFEHKFFEDLKNCNLDYSIVNMNILERDNPKEYDQKKKECKNMKKMMLYFLYEINYDSNKLNMKLEFSNKSVYGSGFYFSDSIEDILRCQNNEKFPEIGESFSLIICEIFYDEEKLREFNMNLSSSDSNQNNKEKVEPNGLKKIEIFHFNDNNSKIRIYTEYVLSEKYQIFPIYTLTLRRNEYFVIYRDPNFVKKNHYTKDLKQIMLRSLKYSYDKNFYFESSTEKALELILKKKKVKVILITSIGRDKSGKRFAEIARRILQRDDLIVLFFSNNTNHLGWIKNFSNCLYASEFDIYEEYISKYNYNSLRDLKEKIEDLYDLKLNFSFNYLSYSNCENDLSFSCFDFNNNSFYFKSVYIFNPKKSLYLSMTKEGKVKKSEKECLWMVTINENDITFFSNGYYLDIDENKEIAIGSKEMKKWSLIKENDEYYFSYTEEGKNDYLSMEDDENIRVNKNALPDNSKFYLNEV